MTWQCRPANAAAGTTFNIFLILIIVRFLTIIYVICYTMQQLYSLNLHTISIVLFKHVYWHEGGGQLGMQVEG